MEAEKEVQAYVKNRFVVPDSLPKEKPPYEFKDLWDRLIQAYVFENAEDAINSYLTGPENKISLKNPEHVRIAYYDSFAGRIPVIYVRGREDFEEILVQLIFRGKSGLLTEEVGAMFVSGRRNRFILLSDKPYSNVTAENMGLKESEWMEKSMMIRREHECTHYYTKQFFGSARNNLHDEGIADFMGIMAAFGEYRAEWFLRFLGIDENEISEKGRFRVYVRELSKEAQKAVARIAAEYAGHLEEWSKTKTFLAMDKEQRIAFLCRRSCVEKF